MNAIPAYITHLTFRNHGELVEMNVQHLNDVFFGAMMENRDVVGGMPLFLPLRQLPGILPQAEDDAEPEDTTYLF